MKMKTEKEEDDGGTMGGRTDGKQIQIFKEWQCVYCTSIIYTSDCAHIENESQKQQF